MKLTVTFQDAVEVHDVSSSLSLVVGGSPPPRASAYQVAVANGFVGTEADWLASLAAGSADLPDFTLFFDGALI